MTEEAANAALAAAPNANDVNTSAARLILSRLRACPTSTVFDGESRQAWVDRAGRLLTQPDEHAVLLQRVGEGKLAEEELTETFFGDAWRAVNEDRLEAAPALIQAAGDRFVRETGRRATAFLIPLEGELRRRRMLVRLREECPSRETLVDHCKATLKTWEARSAQLQEISDLVHPRAHLPLTRIRIRFLDQTGAFVPFPGSQDADGGLDVCLAIDHILSGRAPLDATIRATVAGT